MSTSSNDSERINTANLPSTPSYSNNIQPSPPPPNARDGAAPTVHSEEVLVDCRSPPTSSPPISNEDNEDGDQPNYSSHYNHQQHAIVTSFASNDGGGSSGSPLNTPGGSIVDPLLGSSSPRGYFPSSLPLPISTNDINNTVPRSTVFAHVPSMYHSTQATKQQITPTPHHCPPTTTPTRQRCHAQVHHPSSFSTTTSAATSVKEIIVREPPLVDHQLQDPLPFTYYSDEASTHPLNYNNDNYYGRPSYAIRFLDRDSGSITTTTPSVAVGSSWASGSLTNPDDINDDFDYIYNTRSSPSSSPESPPSELIPLVESLRDLNHRSAWAPPPSSNVVASNFHPQPFI